MKHSNHPRKLIIPIVGFLVFILLISNRVFAQSNTCGSPTAITSLTTCTTGTSQLTGQTLSGSTTSSPNVATTCTGTPGGDVWYQFVAKTTNPTIALSSLGTSFQSTSTRVFIQLLYGACASLTSAGCSRSAGTSATTFSYTASGLTIGTTYYIRIYTLTASPTGGNWGYTICLTDPAPTNDICSGATTLTPALTCSNITDNFYASDATGAPTITGSCAGSVTYDLWYSFVATNTNATVTMSSIGSSITNSGLELLSGNCTTMTSLGCGATSVSSSSLTIGSTYYIRAYSTGTAPTSPTNAAFNLCVTYTVPNDDCTNAITLTSATTCNNTTGSLVGSTYTAITGACGASSGNRNDVWYKFVAQTSNPTITVNSFSQRSIQLFSGTCGALTSVQCSVNNSNLVASSLIVGNTYYVRIWSDNNSSIASFTICIKDPANDVPATPVALVPNLTCSNTAGNVFGAGITSAPTITGTCVAGTVTYDMWYTFVAPAANANITLSSVGSSITNYGIQVLTGTSSTMSSLFCGTSSIAAYGLTIGSTYYVRVYSTGTPPVSTANADFNICVTYTAPPPPPNDNCAGAINLPVAGGCSNTTGTMSSATASTGFPTSCPGTAAYDVWYKFTATTNTTTTITTSTFGTGIVSSAANMELYSGTCGSLTSLACGTTSIAQVLTTGTTYYVRIYVTTGPAPTVNGDFKICVTTVSPPPRIGNSYVNLTKNTVGGVVQNGDILEIRMTIVNTSNLFSTRYVDNIPTKTTMMAGSTDSIRIITNEGLTYRNYTPGNDLDAATYLASPGAGEYNIKINLGQTSNLPSAPADNTATNTTGAGNLTSSGKPVGGGGIMFATSFRVQVTGNVGDTIILNGGQFIYETSAGGTDFTLSGSPYKILITDPLTLCSNSAGVNNASEFGGTFGSGSNLNRSTDLSFPIAGYSFVTVNGGAQVIGDGQYAIVNNTSPISGTNNNANRQPNCISTSSPDMLCANRMFSGFWYIKGDHSGTNNSTGNAPAASNSTSGYMLAVNADYVASEAYRQTLTGLCPNTYYEFSAWFQNICPVCGIDSLGKQFTNSAILANQAGYPGVYPNLSFSLDGLDRYSTGQIDTVGWVKKGFVFKTDTSQTTATLSIRNNAQGGGGNDWVMDDISIATCFPSMSYSPTATPSVCSGNTITIGDTVRSQFNNYTFYVWQRSTDNGATWTNITSTQTATPTLSGGQYQYITSFAIPPSSTNPADSGDIYRVYTATTNSNITTPNCIANDGSAPISLSVLTCGIALKTDLLSFNGNLMNKYGVLSWSTSLEDQPVHFELQRSDDNITFTTITTVNGKNNGQVTNYYSYTDPDLIDSKKWYRVILVNEKGNKKYSHIIQLSSNPVDFELENVINPFSDQLLFNVILNKGSKVNVELIDMQGKIAKSSSYIVYSGVNSLRILNTDVLASGIYTLRIENNGSVISKKVMKK